jgi:uncharacterized protein YutD
MIDDKVLLEKIKVSQVTDYLYDFPNYGHNYWWEEIRRVALLIRVLYTLSVIL